MIGLDGNINIKDTLLKIYNGVVSDEDVTILTYDSTVHVNSGRTNHPYRVEFGDLYLKTDEDLTALYSDYHEHFHTRYFRAQIFRLEDEPPLMVVKHTKKISSLSKFLGEVDVVRKVKVSVKNEKTLFGYKSIESRAYSVNYKITGELPKDLELKFEYNGRNTYFAKIDSMSGTLNTDDFKKDSYYSRWLTQETNFMDSNHKIDIDKLRFMFYGNIYAYEIRMGDYSALLSEAEYNSLMDSLRIRKESDMRKERDIRERDNLEMLSRRYKKYCGNKDGAE